MPNFCYGCGILGHVLEDCDLDIPEEEAKQYGDLLRAKGNNGNSWIIGGKNHPSNTQSSSSNSIQESQTGHNRLTETTKKMECLMLKGGGNKEENQENSRPDQGSLEN